MRSYADAGNGLPQLAVSPAVFCNYIGLGQQHHSSDFARPRTE